MVLEQRKELTVFKKSTETMKSLTLLLNNRELQIIFICHFFIYYCEWEIFSLTII